MKTKNKKIALIGLGYVGLPLAVEFGKKRSIVGFDINQTRINEIENIALENPYYDLRQWIALSYVARSEVREVNSNTLKKSFNILHKSINENFFRSIPLAIYTTKYKELHEERKKLIN